VKVPKKNIFAKISQLKQFPISSELARQSVLVKIEQDEGFASVKVRYDSGLNHII